MSRYETPFCSDEELLKELNKLGYDEVSPDVFNMMKDDLADLVEKEHVDTPFAKYDNNIPPLSSEFVSDPSDAFLGDHTKQTSKKAPSISRKVKKKSPKKSSRAKQNPELEKFVSDSNSCQNTVNELETRKSANASFELDYEKVYDIPTEDTLADINAPQGNYDGINELKSNDNYTTSQSLRSDINRNEDIMHKNTPRSYKSKESDLHLGYSAKNDRFASHSDTSVNKNRSNVSKDNKHTSSWGKANEHTYNLSTTRKAAADNSLKTVREAFKTFKLDKNPSESDEYLHNNYKGSNINLNSSQSSTSSETKTIKRKVLRRRNGRSIITEELVEIPTIFDTSYPESENFNSSKSFSSDDLSSKSNGSTGSTTTISPESIKSSPSTFSLLSTRSTSFRVPNGRKKKSDPVAMYGYYKKFWDNFKPPGENTHDRLRWAVRDKMLEYNI